MITRSKSKAANCMCRRFEASFIFRVCVWGSASILLDVCFSCRGLFADLVNHQKMICTKDRGKAQQRVCLQSWCEHFCGFIQKKISRMMYNSSELNVALNVYSLGRNK